MATDIDAAYDVADPMMSPEEAVVLRWSEGRRIKTCMEDLEPERAFTARHAYIEGLSCEALAELHGVPRNTMKTRLRRSLLKLRECMSR